ncbi:hypothetical protein ISS85_04705 [Candidatus Microgenomates bacterium]|nr:hypothetical protein [Candidatus Microgenomates bacterium]
MLKTVFLTLIGSALVIFSTFFVPQVTELFRGPAFLILWASFSLLGLLLISLTRKEKIKGRLRKYLLLTGGSAAGFLISVVLHNLLYALAIIFQPVYVLSKLMEVFHGIFFLIATLACPIGFLIGALQSVLEFKKR